MPLHTVTISRREASVPWVKRWQQDTLAGRYLGALAASAREARAAVYRSAADYSSFPSRHFRPSVLRVGMWEDEKSLKKKINVIKPQIKTEANVSLLFSAFIFLENSPQGVRIATGL